MQRSRRTALKRQLPIGQAIRGAAAVLVALACAGLLSCGPSGEEADDTSSGPEKMARRYRVDRIRNSLIRLDLMTGQMWIAPHTGAGGWRTAGEAPPAQAAAGTADGPRFTVLPLDLQKLQALGAARHVLRANRRTGDGWVGKVSADPNWFHIPDTNQARAGAANAGRKPPGPGPGPGPGEEEAMQVISKQQLAASEDQGFSEESIEQLVAAMDREGLPLSIRVWATLQLGELSPSVAVPPLLEALKSEEPEVVIAAISSLRKSGVASTIPAILKLKDHPDPRVREAVNSEVIEKN